MPDLRRNLAQEFEAMTPGGRAIHAKCRRYRAIHRPLQTDARLHNIP